MYHIQFHQINFIKNPNLCLRLIVKIRSFWKIKYIGQVKPVSGRREVIQSFETKIGIKMKREKKNLNLKKELQN